MKNGVDKVVSFSSTSKRAGRRLALIIAIVFAMLAQLAAVSVLLNLLPIKAGIALIFSAPFAIGIGNYFLFNSLGRQSAVQDEAQRWLAGRLQKTVTQRSRARSLKQMIVWVPSVLVLPLFLFLPESFGVMTHFWWENPSELKGYEVELPATWIVDGWDAGQASTWAFVGAFECKGLVRSGIRRYLRATPIVSEMSFRTPSGISPEHEQWRGAPLSQDTVRLNTDSITCLHYTPRYRKWESSEELRDIECSTAKGDLAASFLGDVSSVPTFYSVLKSIRRIP